MRQSAANIRVRTDPVVATATLVNTTCLTASFQGQQSEDTYSSAPYYPQVGWSATLLVLGFNDLVCSSAISGNLYVNNVAVASVVVQPGSQVQAVDIVISGEVDDMITFAFQVPGETSVAWQGFTFQLYGHGISGGLAMAGSSII